MFGKSVLPLFLVVVAVGNAAPAALGWSPSDSPGDPANDAQKNDAQNPPSEGKKDKKGGDPVELSTGAFSYSTEVISVDSTKGHLSVGFEYLSSADGFRSNVGPSWTHNYEQELVLRVERSEISVKPYQGPLGDAPSVALGRGGGQSAQAGSSGGGTLPAISARRYKWSLYHYHGLRIDRYTNHTSGVSQLGGELFVSEDSFSRILPNAPLFSDGGVGDYYSHGLPSKFEMRLQNGTVFSFERSSSGVNPQEWDFVDGWEAVAYSLTRIEYPTGQATVLEYAGGLAGYVGGVRGPLSPAATRKPAKLTKVISHLGAELTFAYDLSSGLLSTITSHLANVTEVVRDASGNVEAIILPEVSTFAEDFVGGPQQDSQVARFEFTYLPGTKLINTIADANEVAANPSAPKPYLKNHWHAGRVVAQELGGVNASGVPAGGRYSFIHEEFNPPVYRQNANFYEVRRTMEIDPNGRAKLVLFDNKGQPRLTYQFAGSVAHPPLGQPASWTIDVNIDEENYSAGGSVAGALWEIPASVDASGALVQRTRVVRRDYNEQGQVIREEQDGEVFEMQYIAGLHLFTERIDGQARELERLCLYEPIFFDKWKEYDARAWDASHVPQNGTFQGNSWERYCNTNVFDYQESNKASVIAALRLDEWAIDVDQFLGLQAALVERHGLVPESFDFGLGASDGNRDGHIEDLFGRVVREDVWVNLAQDLTAPSVSFNSTKLETLYDFNSYGLLKESTSVGGRKTHYYYYPVGAVDLTDYSSGSMEFGGLLAKTVGGVGLPGEVVSAYKYYGGGAVVENINHYGAVTRTHYDERWRQVAVLSDEGAWHLEKYDPNGNQIESKSINALYEWTGVAPTDVPAPNVEDSWVESVYDLLDNRVETRIHYTSEGTSKVAVTKNRFDRSGRMVLTLYPDWDPQTSKGSVAGMVHDAWGNLYEESFGGATALFLGLPWNQDIPEIQQGLLGTGLEGGISSTVRLYKNGQPVRVIDPLGRESAIAYGANGLPNRWVEPRGGYKQVEHDSLGNVTREFQVGWDGLVVSDKHFMYDELLRVIQEDQRILRESGDLQDPQDFDDGPLTPGDGYVTTRVKYNAAGDPIERVDDLARLSVSEYDDFHNLRKSVDAVGNTREFLYAPMNLPVREVTLHKNTADPGGGLDVTQETWNFYSPSGRLIAHANAKDSAGLRAEVTRYVYDALGRPVLILDSLSGSPATLPMASLDRFGLGLNVGYSTVVEPNGNAVVRTYDGRGLKTAEKRYMRVGGVGSGAISAGPNGGVVSTHFVYNELGKLNKGVDPEGEVTEYIYDNQGRIVELLYPTGSAASIQYDLAGQPEVLLDANGNTLTRTFNANGQLEGVAVTKAAGVEGVDVLGYRYDGGGRVVEAWSVDNSAGSGGQGLVVVRRKYNSISGMYEEVINGVKSTAKMDSLGNCTEEVYPRSEFAKLGALPYSTVEYERLDPNSRITAVRLLDGATQDVVEYDYLGVAFSSEVKLGNNVTLEHTYDSEMYRAHTEVRDANSAFMFSWSYKRDNSGSKTEQVLSDSQHANKRVFSHDSTGRLTNSERYDVTGTLLGSVSYSLDGAGNRDVVNGGPSAGVYGTAGPFEELHLYANTPLWSQASDTNGSVITQASTTQPNREFMYDAYNRMVGVEWPSTGAKARYVYGPFGRRVLKRVESTNSATWTHFRYSVSGLLAHEEESSGFGAAGNTVEFFYGNNVQAPVASRLLGGSQGIIYAVRDEAGSLAATVDGTGTVMQRWEYSDYGIPLDPNTWQVVNTGAPGANMLYSGKYMDWETGNYYSGARMYDPWQGRFLSTDPIGIWGDQEHLGNGYSYGGNSPWTFGDPSGMSSVISAGPQLKPGMSGREVALAFAPFWPPREKPKEDEEKGGEKSKDDNAKEGNGQTANRAAKQTEPSGDMDESDAVQAIGDLYELYEEFMEKEAELAAKGEGMSVTRANFLESLMAEIARMEATADMDDHLQVAAIVGMTVLATNLLENAHSSASYSLHSQMMVFEALAELVPKPTPIPWYLSDTTIDATFFAMDTADFISTALTIKTGGAAAPVKVATSKAKKKAKKRLRNARAKLLKKNRAKGRKSQDYVKNKYDIGNEKRIEVNGRNRRPDGINEKAGTLSEVKNVKKLGRTREVEQIRDYADYAQAEGLKFNLYVRPGQEYTEAMSKLIAERGINVIEVPHSLFR